MKIEDQQNIDKIKMQERYSQNKDERSKKQWQECDC